MPWPKPKEEKQEYLRRAIEYMIVQEGLTSDHATAKAHGMWKQKKKKGSKKHG